MIKRPVYPPRGVVTLGTRLKRPYLGSNKSVDRAVQVTQGAVP
jgi:hypothetical protein